MRPMRIVVLCVALTLGAAVFGVSVQMANAQPASPTIVLPSNGATLSGTQYLDVVAPGATQVQYELTGGRSNNQVIAAATLTIVGWAAAWNTTTLANGTYTLNSVASYPSSVTATSTPITVTVDNPPPSTAVIIPSNNATVSGTSLVLDSTASSSVTQVQYEITGGTLTDSVIAAGTPTLYGWLAEWNTTTVANGSYSLHSVASLSGGVTGTSPGVTITVDNAPPKTSVVYPASGATLDSTQTQYFDAVASSGVTEVTFDLTAPGSVSYTLTATSTSVGWIAVQAGTPIQPGSCGPIPVPVTIQSVASYAGGVSGTSAPVSITENSYTTLPGGGC
jgi:hypothetical protein